VDCNVNFINVNRCDKCEKWFHFMCLSPPLKYSPKRRGYSWYCSDCDDEEQMSDPKIGLQVFFTDVLRCTVLRTFVLFEFKDQTMFVF